MTGVIVRRPRAWVMLPHARESADTRGTGGHMRWLYPCTSHFYSAKNSNYLYFAMVEISRGLWTDSEGFRCGRPDIWLTADTLEVKFHDLKFTWEPNSARGKGGWHRDECRIVVVYHLLKLRYLGSRGSSHIRSWMWGPHNISTRRVRNERFGPVVRLQLS